MFYAVSRVAPHFRTYRSPTFSTFLKALESTPLSRVLLLMLSCRSFLRISRCSPSYATRSLSLVSHDNSSVTVDLDDQKPIRVSFKTAFLRDSCNAPESVDVDTRQKSFTTAQVALNHKLAEDPTIVDTENGNALQIKWKQADGSVHVSTYPEAFLKKHASLPSRMKGKFFPERQVFWTNEEIVEDLHNLHVEYKDYFEGVDDFRKVVNGLNKYGIFFVDNMEDPLDNPQTHHITPHNELLWPVAKLAQRFGYIKKTFYGTLFDVKNEKKAKNIANTNVFLPLHMDLCYYESPPGLQLLHFIKNSTLGGENVFSDSFAAVKHIRQNDRVAYEALKKVPITYHYDNNGEYYYYLRPLIVEDPYIPDFTTGEARIKEVNYSPPFQGNFEFGVTKDENPELFKDFMRGMVKFEEFINDPKNQYVVKMPENTCVIFDNRRVLHSRLQFSDSNGGDRWLMGCYVDGDSFRSKLRVLNR